MTLHALEQASRTAAGDLAVRGMVEQVRISNVFVLVVRLDEKHDWTCARMRRHLTHYATGWCVLCEKNLYFQWTS